MLRSIRIAPALLVAMGSVSLWTSGCHGAARCCSHRCGAVPVVVSDPCRDATGMKRIGPADEAPAPEPSARRPAQPDDPYGQWQVEVLVLDGTGGPVEGAVVRSERGSATTNADGRAWLPPFGFDMGRPTRDRAFKTLVVSRPGYVTTQRWLGDEIGTLHVFRLVRAPR